VAGQKKAGDHSGTQDIPAKLRERIERGLERTERDYLTVPQLVRSLPKRLRNTLGIEGETKPGSIAERIGPYLGVGFRIRKGQRSLCVCRTISEEELVFREAARRPGLTSKQLKAKLPLKESEFLPALNSLLQRGDLFCTLNREHRPLVTPVGQPAGAPVREEEDQGPMTREERNAFHKAYETVGSGRRFVRIHLIREHLQWPRERFDRILAELRRNFEVQLHGGDPSSMTETEIRDSYKDEQGRLYIALTWSER